MSEGGEAVFCRKLAVFSWCGIGARGEDLRRVACFKERREGGVAERNGGRAVGGVKGLELRSREGEV